VFALRVTPLVDALCQVRTRVGVLHSVCCTTNVLVLLPVPVHVQVRSTVCSNANAHHVRRWWRENAQSNAPRRGTTCKRPSQVLYRYGGSFTQLLSRGDARLQ